MKSIKDHIYNFMQTILQYFKSTERLEIEAVKEQTEVIKNITNPSEKVQFAAVERDLSSIQYIDNATDKVQLYAIERDIAMIKHIKKPIERVQLYAIEKDPHSIQHFYNPSESVKLAAVKQDPSAIKHIKNPSKEVQLAAIKQDSSIIKHINNPTTTAQLVAVRQDPSAIKHINNPSEEVQLAAVTLNPSIIQEIKNPTEAVQQTALKTNSQVHKFIEKFQIEAVNKNPLLIQKIKAPSEKVQSAAISKNPLLIQYIADPSEKVKLAAVEINPLAIMYIENPSEKVQITAINGNADVIRYIENPTTTACQAALDSIYKGALNIEIDKVENFSEKTKDFFIEIAKFDPTQINIDSSQETFISTFEKPMTLNSETAEMITTFKEEIENESNDKIKKIQKEKVQSSIEHYKELGYKSIEEIIPSLKVNEKREINICSSKCKTLQGDITINSNSEVEISNLRINDKTTGRTESLNSKDFNLLDHSSSTVRKALNGKVEIKKGNNAGKLMGINKSASGWVITIGKQVFKAADSSAEA